MRLRGSAGSARALILTGQVAIVTGGSVGIGYAVASALSQAGAWVVVVGRTPQRVEKAVEQLKTATGLSHMGMTFDVSREEDMEEMAKKVLDRYGRIDLLIASAGVLRPKGGAIRTLREMSLAEWKEVIDINLTGTFFSNRAVLPAMIRQRSGQIINVSSTSGRKGLAYDSAYCASKFGVIGMSEALAEEVRPYGVRVQTMLPGAIETPMWGQNGPLPKPSEVLLPERVADLVLHLVTLPADTLWLGTIIEPFRTHGRPAWLQSAVGHG